MTSLKDTFLAEIQSTKIFAFARIHTANNNLHKAEILFFPHQIPSEKIGHLFNETIEDQSLFPLFADFIERQIQAALSFSKQTNCPKVNINIPLAVFESEYKDDILSILRSVPNTEKLCLEITENSKAQNLQKLKPIFNELKDLGYQFVIDDLGSGYHDLTQTDNLAYMTELLSVCPLHDIKIDFELAKDFEENLDHISKNIAHFEALYLEYGHNINDLKLTFEFPLTSEQQLKAKKITKTPHHFFQTLACKA